MPRPFAILATAEMAVFIGDLCSTSKMNAFEFKNGGEDCGENRQMAGLKSQGSVTEMNANKRSRFTPDVPDTIPGE